MEVLQRTANRGSISTGRYEIDNSCKFEEDNTEFLWKKFSGEGTGTGKTFTISGWVKRTELGGIDIFMGVGRDVGGDANDGALRFNSDQFQFVNFASNAYNVRTNAVFRDTSAFYHIMVAVDTTQGTDSNRVKLYVNGVLQTSLTGTAYPTQNYQFKWGRAEEHMVGARPDSDATAGEPQASQLWSGYMADVYFVDGLQLAPTDFGEFDDDSGIWVPIKASPTFGNNGFYLDFADSGDLGDDESGNGNDFTEVNISAADQATDTPTNNFATINVLWGNDRMPLISEGATVIGHNANSYKYAPATMGVANGKWYWEIKPTVNGNTLVSGAGIASNQGTLFFYEITGNFVYHYDGDRYVNGGASSYGAAWATNDIIGFAYDADNWTLTAYVNNSSQGNLLASQTDISSELFIPYVYSFGTHTYQTNFGGYTTMSNTHTNTDANGYGSFVYAPPSGYYALCTKNLAEHG